MMMARAKRAGRILEAVASTGKRSRRMGVMRRESMMNEGVKRGDRKAEEGSKEKRPAYGERQRTA